MKKLCIPGYAAARPGACVLRVILPIIPMPNNAKCGPALPVPADLKLPQRRRLQRRLLRTTRDLDEIGPCPPSTGGGTAHYCVLTWVWGI